MNYCEKYLMFHKESKLLRQVRLPNDRESSENICLCGIPRGERDWLGPISISLA